MRDSDDTTRISYQGRWAKTVDMVDGTFRMLATGASWSGHERNHLFFGGLPNHQFERLSGVSGLDDPGDSRAFATLDYNRDGWLDMALVNVSTPRFRLLRNEIGDRPGNADHRFVALKLMGGNDTPMPSDEWSSRDGLGAYVRFEFGDGSSVYREHRIDDGFKAQNSATMIVGIGPRDEVRAISVRWPSGRMQSFEGVPAGSLVTVHENASQSPTGDAFVVTNYRDSNEALADAGASEDSWQSRMLPMEPSATTLALSKEGQPLSSPSGLTLYTTMATWCVACATEVPELNKLRESFSDAQLAMYAVPVDGKDTNEKLEAWMGRYAPPYELLTNLPASEIEKMQRAVKAELLDTNRVPATIVTDSTGRVVLARWGAPTISELRALLWRSQASSTPIADGRVDRNHEP